MSARFRPEDREKIKPRLIEFMKSLAPEVQGAGMMIFLTAGEIYTGSLLATTVNALSPNDPSMVMEPIMEETESLYQTIKEDLAGTSPQVAITTLLLLLNEQVGMIEAQPEDHPWAEKAMDLIDALKASARDPNIH